MSKFLRVQCECGAESIIFGDTKSEVKCLSCRKATLATPTGGRGRINCKIVEVLG